MNTSTLITDSSSPFACALADEYAGRGHPVCLATDYKTDGSDKNRLVRPETGPLLCQWVKTSSLSARSLVLACETVLGAPSVAVLCLDGLAESLATGPSTATGLGMGDLLCRNLDTHIKPVAHLVQNLLSRFRKAAGGLLCFVIREIDCEVSTGITGSGAMPSQDIVLASTVTCAAFRALAESCARNATASTGFRVLLIKLEDADEATNARWLADRLAEQTTRTQSDRWLKAGSRGLISLHKNWKKRG